MEPTEFFEIGPDGHWSPRSFVAPYPFVREEFHGLDEDGPFTTKTWNPGVRHEMVDPENAEELADGEGMVEYSVISVHQPPGRYPARVFFTRRFQTPNGKWFGKRRLHIMTVQAFRRRLRGYPISYQVSSMNLAPRKNGRKPSVLGQGGGRGRNATA